MRPLHLIGIVLITCIVLFLSFYLFKEGFTNANSDKQKEFVNRQLKNYNPYGISLIAGGTQGNLGTDTTPLTGTFGDTSKLGGKSKFGQFPLSDGKHGFFEIIAKCEAVVTADCSAFDDPTFGTNCGLCLDIGTTTSPALNSQGKPSIGGRVLLPDDRKFAEGEAVSNFMPSYSPTLGTCPAGRLVSTKAQCLEVKREMACENGANYDQANCSQCYDDSIYSIVDPKNNPNLLNGSGTINLVGSGTLNFSETGHNTRNNIVLSSTPTVIELQGPEMTRFTLNVVPASDGTKASIAGYISGITATGSFTMDIYRLIVSDSFTGRKPRIGGPQTFNGVDTTIMVPGFGQTRLGLIGSSPFTFVEPLTREGAKCKSSPFITTPQGATLLGSDPCYAKGAGPGKYPLECLQNTFISNGCITAGKGYPNDATAAAALMTNANGTNRSINDIANYIYSNAVITSTGVDSTGKKLSIDDWSAASVFCTGNAITSPCDNANKDTGPLSPDCLSYLWNNMGNAKSVGPTYNIFSMATSLFSVGNNSQFCQSTGTLSPLNENGKPNENAITYWQAQGGVANVISIMKSIHQNANNTSYMTDEQRAPYINQCYGPISLNPRPASETALSQNGCAYPDGSDMTGFCGRTAPFTLTANTIAGTVDIPVGNYTMAFNITPLGTSSDWANFIHITLDKGNCCNFNQRSPGIWFHPNSTKLHIIFGDSTNGNWGWNSDKSLPMNQSTLLKIVAENSNIAITIGTDVTYLTQPTYRPTGTNFTVYMSDPWYTAANAGIDSFEFVVDGVNFIPKINIPPSANSYTAPVIQNGTINVTEASYGKNCNPSLKNNRTALFKQLTQNKTQLNYSFDYTKTGGDPAGGCGKTLEITYNCVGNGTNSTYTVPSEAGYNGSVKLNCPIPPPPPPLYTITTDNGYNQYGWFATHFPSPNQILITKSTPIYPPIGGSIVGSFVQPGTTVTNITNTQQPSNPAIPAKILTLSKPLVGIAEDRGQVFTYTDDPAAKGVQTCSSPNANLPPTVSGWNYKGCFKDTNDRALKIRLGQVNSIEQCIANAKAAGYNTAGNQFYGECWAGNNTDWNKHGDAGCCPPIGGAWNQQIYSTR